MSGAVALFGPTAVGKTDVAVALARLMRERGEDPVAISADAFQAYVDLDALTGKPPLTAVVEFEHRLISFVPLRERLSVGRYARLAHAEVDSALAAGRRPIVVGGTGLYLRAALADLDLRPRPSDEIRARCERLYDELGPQAAHAELTLRDPGAAARIHPNDRRRVVRGLELAAIDVPGHRDAEQLWSRSTRVPTVMVGLLMERRALRARIEARAGTMLAGPAIAEVRHAILSGASATARKAIGFSDIQRHIEGEIGAGELRTRVVTRTQQYARRQITWMRKLPDAAIVDCTSLAPRAVAVSVLEQVDAAPRR